MDYQFNFHEVFNLIFNLGDFVKRLLKLILLCSLRGTSVFQKYISWLLLQNSETFLLHKSRHFGSLKATKGLFSFPLCGRMIPEELQKAFPSKDTGMAFRLRYKAVNHRNDCVDHSDSVHNAQWRVGQTD